MVRRRSWIRGEVSGGREKGEPKERRRNERAEDDREWGRAVDSCCGVTGEKSTDAGALEFCSG